MDRSNEKTNSKIESETFTTIINYKEKSQIQARKVKYERTPKITSRKRRRYFSGNTSSSCSSTPRKRRKLESVEQQENLVDFGSTQVEEQQEFVNSENNSQPVQVEEQKESVDAIKTQVVSVINIEATPDIINQRQEEFVQLEQKSESVQVEEQKESVHAIKTQVVSVINIEATPDIIDQKQEEFVQLEQKSESVQLKEQKESVHAIRCDILKEIKNVCHRYDNNEKNKNLSLILTSSFKMNQLNIKNINGLRLNKPIFWFVRGYVIDVLKKNSKDININYDTYLKQQRSNLPKLISKGNMNKYWTLYDNLEDAIDILLKDERLQNNFVNLYREVAKYISKKPEDSMHLHPIWGNEQYDAEQIIENLNENLKLTIKYLNDANESVAICQKMYKNSISSSSSKDELEEEEEEEEEEEKKNLEGLNKNIILTKQYLKHVNKSAELFERMYKNKKFEEKKEALDGMKNDTSLDVKNAMPVEPKRRVRTRTQSRRLSL